MKLVPSKFTKYELTPTEQHQAEQLTELQVARIQTLIADLAEGMLELRFDPASPGDFIQNQAHATGMIKVLEQLLLDSEHAKSTPPPQVQSNVVTPTKE